MKLSKPYRFAIELALLLSVFAVFATFGPYGMTDDKYAMLLSENLLRNHSFIFDERSMPHLEPYADPGYRANGYPYQIEEVDGHPVYFYPVGSSLLSLPLVMIMNIGGVSAHTPDGAYNEEGELLIEGTLASFLMATLTVVFFRIALLVLPLSWSLVLALGGAFSTQIWSTASRSLWSHTWQLLLGGLIAYLLLAEDGAQVSGRPVILATLLSWAYFVRPTSSIAIIAISAYMLIARPREFVAFAITGALWMAGFVAYSWTVFGQLLPDYYLFHLTRRHLLEAVAGNLISPSRGLFVYVPAAAFTLLLIAYYRRTISHRPLVVLSLVIIVLHLLVVSTDPNWWGGHCYGARMTTDIIPWLFMLATLGCSSLQRERSSTFKHFAAAFGLLTLVVGAVINGRGAIAQSTSDWSNGPPEDVDRNPARVWDWSNPQFLSDLRQASSPKVS